MTGTRVPAFLAVCLLALTLAIPWAALGARAAAQEATPVTGDAGDGAVLFFAAPGMRSDLAEAFAAEGALPTIADMLETGANASGGLIGPFPATNGTSLPTLLTGTWPAEHGIVGDRFFRTGAPDFADFANWDDPGLILADTLPQAVERAGKSVVSVGWGGVAGLDPALAGPVVGDAEALSQAGVVANYDVLEQTAVAESLDVGYDRVELRPAEGWTDAPESFSPAQETDLAIRSLDAAGANPDREYDVYIYDSTDDALENYDRVLVATEKNAAAPVADLASGAWASASVPLAGEQEGMTAGFWLKAIDLAPDLSRFRLYYTPVSRLNASWTGCANMPVCEAPGGFAEALNTAIGAPVGVDAAPLQAGVIDEATFVAQGITSSWQTVDALRYIVADLGVEPDLLLLGTSFPAAVSEQFLALLDERDEAGAAATPMADGAGDRVGVDADALLGFVRDGYTMADEILAVGRDLIGSDATTLLASPGGLAPSWLAVDAGQVLVEAGVAETAQPDNCVPGPVSAPPGTPDPEALPVGPAVKACWAGGTAHIYVNLDGREAAGSVAEDAYEPTREGIIAAFESLMDDGAQVVAEVFRKEDLRDVGGADALHPSRTGDIVVTLAQPYRFGATAEGMAIDEAPPLAVGGYLPEDGSAGFLLAEGPDIAAGASVPARAIDVAPTAAFLLDVPGPYNASGSILYGMLANGESLLEVTLLDISDFHGQLPPLSASADNFDEEGAAGSSYDVGGVAFLAPWFDHYRGEAQGEAILVTAGDAVGATPPISNAFGDLPTIEAMNALGFTADALGNHNFDVSVDNMFGNLAPNADFYYLSVNLVPARADATPEVGEEAFLPSVILDVNDVNVGLIGFSNPDIPDLTRPGALDPYRVIDPVAPINEEADALRWQGAEVVIAMGHMGALGGTLTEPTGPVVNVAEQLEGVDLVVGDHTDVQVSAVLPNDVMLVENRSKGVMFTRVRLVVRPGRNELVYRTADHHRPWNIGMTPDAEIAEQLDALEVELAPIFGEVIGAATLAIPRSDDCGQEAGRLCESLIGNVVADALRTTYGTDFAVTNSGGIRADLTCPPEGNEFCPTDAGPNVITAGQVLTVLPFGNIAVTLELTGAELKAMLEAGVRFMPEASGAFPQVSGLCFTYDIAAEPGNRLTGAVRQAADGSCTGEAIDLTEAATYTLATNDFTASGGDGYPELLSRANSREILADVVAAYVAGEASTLDLPGEPIDPRIEGRIVCEGEGCPVPIGA